MGSYSVAAAQTHPLRGDVTGNIEVHRCLIRLAAAEGVNTLVFPELSLTGYELDLAAGLAFSPDDARLQSLAELARAYSMTLIVGAPIQRAGRLYLGAFILSPHTGVEMYTKHFLGAFSSSANSNGVVPPPESTVFEPGDLNPLINLGTNVAALAICADTSHGTHPMRAAERGASLYLASMFIIPAELEREAVRFRKYAQEHSMMVVMANFGGPSGGLPSGGQSTLWSEQGEVLAQLGSTDQGLVIATKEEGWVGRAVLLGS